MTRTADTRPGNTGPAELPAADGTGQQMVLTVRRHALIAVGVVELILADPGGRDLPPWTAGSHLDVTVRAPGGEVTRQYSLCGSPHNLGTYRIAVLLEQAGRGGSRAIHESVLEGDLITTRGPRNNFALDAAERYLFIGGGIGIAPLLPMLATADSSGAQWQLLYGGRTRQSMAYLDELSRFGSQVAIRPESESGLLLVAEFLAEPDGRTLVYCCGPDRLLRAVAAAMRTWPARSLRVERFAASQLAPRKADRPIEVALARTGMTLIVPPGQSILEALEEAGVPVISSCREGICGTCETRILSGRADHRDSVLTAAEREEQEAMMICVSRGLTGHLTLDI